MSKIYEVGQDQEQERIEFAEKEHTFFSDRQKAFRKSLGFHLDLTEPLTSEGWAEREEIIRNVRD